MVLVAVLDDGGLGELTIAGGVDGRLGAFDDGVVECWLVGVGVFSGIILFCEFYVEC